VKNLTRLALAAILVAALPALAAAAKPGPPPGKYAREYAEMNKPSWKKSFPRLGNFVVLAPSTPGEGKKGAYNCIAHTLKIYNKWVWPGKTVADFDRLYSSHGYRRVKLKDYRFNPRMEKIVLYGKRGANGLECTHASRQLTDGTWTSKLGQGPLIRHDTPDSVDGPSYGHPLAVYVRARRVPQSGMGRSTAVASTRPVR
jgi:type VI secretion system secreted protein VgrG